MAKKRTRSPLREVPLRIPGQSLQNNIDDLLDNALLYIITGAVYVCFAIYAWFDFLFQNDVDPIFLTLFTVGIIAISAYKLFKIKQKITLLKMARDGERIVGQELLILA